MNYADLRQVDTADVYIDGRLAARLHRDARDSVRFNYLEPLPTDQSRKNAVSWSLPLSSTDVVATAGSVPPYFAGLLPEGVRLSAAVESTKTSLDDHLTLLMAVGADAIGNVRVVPAGAAPPHPAVAFIPGSATNLVDLFHRLAGSVATDPVALPGVQAKVSAAMWSVPARTPAGAAILKLTPPTGFPRLSENEHFFLSMARSCGLRVPRHELIADDHGHTGLLVERFDRIGAQRIPQEDACQVAGLYPASKYRISAQAALIALADACARGGGSRAVAMLDLLRTVVFSWLIGNGDLHAKNLSIYAPDGLWQPTPAYDLLCTQPYTGWRDPMALDLYGRANRFHRRDFVEAGVRLGLRDRAVHRMIDELVIRAQPWPKRVGEIGFGDRQTSLLEAMLRERLLSLAETE